MTRLFEIFKKAYLRRLAARRWNYERGRGTIDVARMRRETPELFS